jgi:pseudouridine synthase
MPAERVQKIIARAGLCSRREAERLIAEGRVRVNGSVVKLGATADPLDDHIKVDGKRVKAPEPLRHILLYKPRQVMTTCDDPEERTTVIDLVKRNVRERVYPIGRLDYQSEGLIILTNDGDLASRVAHPRYGVVREYLVKIRGSMEASEMARLRRGTSIDGHQVVPKLAVPERRTREGNSWWRVQVTEGRTHEVRELFFRAGHHVQRLRRTAIGPVRDDRLGPGDYRDLTETELADLRRVVAKAAPRKRKPGPPRGRKPAGGKGGSRRRS